MVRFLVWVGFVVGLNDLPSVIKISSAIAPDCSNSDFSLMKNFEENFQLNWH